MGECVECGADVKNKNNVGHFRSRCHRCIAEVAGTTPEQAAPINGCECDLCQPSQADG